MRIYYDFHIHSALSPCADNDMAPAEIVAMASVKGIEAIAVADHNAIANVPAVMECGAAFGVTVVPAVEVQTAEDIHILCLFSSLESLRAFFDELHFPSMLNREDIFGEQLIMDADGNVIGNEQKMLLIGAMEDCYEVVKLTKKHGGAAVPAHVDRESNGMAAILGEVPPDLSVAAVEFSPAAPEELRNRYGGYIIITDSDSHHLTDLSVGNWLEVTENSAQAIVDALNGIIDN